MADKEVTNRFKIMAPGGQATPAPPLGPVLGAKGVNPGQFIQQFNAATGALNVSPSPRRATSGGDWSVPPWPQPPFPGIH